MAEVQRERCRSQALRGLLCCLRKGPDWVKNMLLGDALVPVREPRHHSEVQNTLRAAPPGTVWEVAAQMVQLGAPVADDADEVESSLTDHVVKSECPRISVNVARKNAELMFGGIQQLLIECLCHIPRASSGWLGETGRCLRDARVEGLLQRNVFKYAFTQVETDDEQEGLVGGGYLSLSEPEEQPSIPHARALQDSPERVAEQSETDEDSPDVGGLSTALGWKRKEGENERDALSFFLPLKPVVGPVVDLTIGRPLGRYDTGGAQRG